MQDDNKKIYSKNNFLLDILKDEYILIVGSEVMFSSGKKQSSDINKYILRNSTDKKSFNALTKDEYQMVHEFCSGTRKIENDFSQLPLSKLLQTRLFRTVFTTTVDHTLEAIMNNIWEGNWRKIVLWENVLHWQEKLKEERKFEFPTPTLVYLFGQANKKDFADDEHNYVINDDIAIEFLEKWMSLMWNKTSPLSKFVRSKKLLAIGCKFDDWYFRFFWHVLTGNLIQDKKKGQNNESFHHVAFHLKENEEGEIIPRDAKKLNHYIQSKDVCFHKKTEAFMEDIKDDLIFNDPSEWLKIQNYNNKADIDTDIFVYYCGEDKGGVRKLIVKLLEEPSIKDKRIWLDGLSKRKNKNTLEAIKRAKVFLIVYTHELEEMGKETVKKAIEEEIMYINQWPTITHIYHISLNGYNFRSEFHNTLNYSFSGYEIEKQSINDNQSQIWNNLINQINDNLKQKKIIKKPNIQIKGEWSIFLSYLSENGNDIETLYYELSKLGYDAWIDQDKLAGSENFNDTISNAIKKSQVFLSLLTLEVADSITNKEHRYILDELNCAQDNEKKIIFLAVNGYDFSKDYHRKLLDKLGKYRSYEEISLLSIDGFCTLKNTLNDLLNTKHDEY